MEKVIFFNEFMEESILHNVLGHKPKGRQPITLADYELTFRGWKDSYPSIEYARGKSVACVMYELSDKDIQLINEYMQCPDTHVQDVLKLEIAYGTIDLLVWKVRDIFPETLPADEYIGYMDGTYDELHTKNEADLAKLRIQKKIWNTNKYIKVFA